MGVRGPQRGGGVGVLGGQGAEPADERAHVVQGGGTVPAGGVHAAAPRVASGRGLRLPAAIPAPMTAAGVAGGERRAADAEVHARGVVQLGAGQVFGQCARGDELAEVERGLVQRVVPAAFGGCADPLGLPPECRCRVAVQVTNLIRGSRTALRRGIGGGRAVSRAASQSGSGAGGRS